MTMSMDVRIPTGATSAQKESISDSDSDSSSTGEEERLRRLFQACDEDGDGLIDSHDLVGMCRLLNMEDSAEEIIQQLGVHGKITFDEFCECRLNLLTEFEEERLRTNFSTDKRGVPKPMTHVPFHGTHHTQILTEHEKNLSQMDSERRPLQSPSWRTSSENSLVSGGGKPESLDYDSGAQDLESTSLQKLIEHHDPTALHELMENTSHLGNQGAATHFLDIANSLHVAALTSLKSEILDLTNRLHHVTSERDMLEKQLSKSNTEKLCVQRESEDRLDQLSQRYEERITELHSVIAELRKKLDRHQINVIREEDEFDESDPGQSNKSNDELSCNENNANESQANSIDIALGPDLRELSRVVSELESAIGERKKVTVDVGTDLIPGDNDSEADRAIKAVKEMDTFKMTTSRSEQFMDVAHHQEQIRILQAENLVLQEQIGKQEIELNKLKAQAGSVREERDRLKRKVRELQTRVQSLEASTSPHSSRVSTPTKVHPPFINPSTGERSVCSAEQMPVLKIAELKKLKTGASGERQVLGAEISSSGLPNAKVAEHLAQSLQECSNMQEIIQTLYKCGNEISENKIQEFEIEMERLTSKIDNLKSQNDLLTITLEESKAQCDRLSVMMGKYESNNTAFQLAMNYTDQALEAYEILVNLLETDQGVLLANCRAAGLGSLGNYTGTGDDQEEVTAILMRMQSARKTAENNARHLLHRLDRRCGIHIPAIATAPWEDLSSTSRTTSTTSSTASSTDADFTKLDEQRLRDYIQHLKNDRATVKLTVLELESVHIDPLAKDPGVNPDSQRLDLENAVLMQELMAMKEEKAELKAHNYLLEKENRALELRLSGKESQEQAYIVQIEHLKCEVKEHQQRVDKDKYRKEEDADTVTPAITLAELRSHNASEIAQDLSEALKRERRLKARVQELVATLEKLSKNSEIRHQQSAEFVNDLKRANSALVTAFEKAKKKYQSKVKRVEQQMQVMGEKYEAQIHMLKQKIKSMETDAVRPATSETSL